MPKTRLKRKAPKLTRREAESTVGLIVRYQREQNVLKLKMDRRIAKTRDEFEGLIDRTAKLIDERVAEVEAWARDNRDEFGKRKSIDFVHAIVGFRTGMHQVKKGRKFRTLALCAKAMQKLTWAKKYVRAPEPKVDKEKLIADRAKLSADQFIQIALQLVQDETFFIDPKDEKLEQGVTT